MLKKIGIKSGKKDDSGLLKSVDADFSSLSRTAASSTRRASTKSEKAENTSSQISNTETLTTRNYKALQKTSDQKRQNNAVPQDAIQNRQSTRISNDTSNPTIDDNRSKHEYTKRESRRNIECGRSSNDSYEGKSRRKTSPSSRDHKKSTESSQSESRSNGGHSESKQDNHNRRASEKGHRRSPSDNHEGKRSSRGKKNNDDSNQTKNRSNCTSNAPNHSAVGVHYDSMQDNQRRSFNEDFDLRRSSRDVGKKNVESSKTKSRSGDTSNVPILRGRSESKSDIRRSIEKGYSASSRDLGINNTESKPIRRSDPARNVVDSRRSSTSRTSQSSSELLRKSSSKSRPTTVAEMPIQNLVIDDRDSRRSTKNKHKKDSPVTGSSSSNKEDIVASLKKQGNKRANEGKFNESRELLEEALKIQEKYSFPELEIAHTLHQIGRVLNSLQCYKESLNILNTSLKLREEYQADGLQIASTIHTIGVVRGHSGDVNGAIKKLMTAAKMQEKILGKPEDATWKKITYFNSKK